MSVQTELREQLQDLARGAGPVLEALARLNADAFTGTVLDERTEVLLRFGALVGIDAPPLSYLTHLVMAEEAGIDAEEIRAALAALAPVVGSARVVSAASNVLQGVELASVG